MPTDITLRLVPGYGWLPIVLLDGAELYRGGRFQETAADALEQAERMMATILRPRVATEGEPYRHPYVSA
jgi:hypothetical protein